MRRRKERLSTRIPPELHFKLAAAGKRAGMSQAKVVEAALEGFFSFERDDQRDAAIYRRLDRMARQFSRLERNDLILVETITLFVRFMLTVTPAVPEGDHAVARVTGTKRFDEFVGRLARQIAGGRRVLEEALGELVPEPGDFASLADLEADPKADSAGEAGLV
jgi:hypothetical protein